MPKPATADGYDSAQLGRVRATCLYFATKLGDLLDELVVVGGLVPSLLVDQEAGLDRHVGTADVDLGLTLAILEKSRYAELTERLRSAGFEPDTAWEKKAPHRWRIDGPPPITLDFLIPPGRPGDTGGHKRELGEDLSAIVSPGLLLALADKQRVVLDGKTIRGEQARRELWVCGPGAFVLMKALALRNRGENKDAYDLVYLLRRYGEGIGDVTGRVRPLLDHPEAQLAVTQLSEDFATIDSIGPMRAAEFLGRKSDEAERADALGAVRQLLAGLPAQKK